MLGLTLVLAGILGLCFRVGNLLFARAPWPEQIRQHDRTLLCTWLGLVVFSTTASAFAAFRPLGPGFLISIALLCFAGLAAHASSRKASAPFQTFRNGLPEACFLLLACAFIGSQMVTNRDAISYQFDLIHWLSSAGIVPGLGLVNSRYGFISPWFNLPAIFNHGMFFARMASLSNVLALFLLLAQWSLSIKRGITGALQAADAFALIAIPTAIALPVFLNFPVSPTPDFGIIALTVVTAWSMILLSASCQNALSKPFHGLWLCLIPVLLGTFAVAVKLSGLPLLLTAALFFGHAQGWAWRRLLIGGSVALVLLLPDMFTSLRISGCPFYPAPPYLERPWSVGESTACREAEVVTNFALWGRAQQPPETIGMTYPRLSWLRYWLRLDKSNTAGFAFFCLSLTGLFLLSRHLTTNIAFFWPTLMGMLGILLLLLKAPAMRFGLGYLTMIPAAAGSLMILHASWRPKIRPRHKAAGWIAVLVPIVLFVPLSYFGKTTSEKRVDAAIRAGVLDLAPGPGWVLPPVIPLLRYNDATGHVDVWIEHRKASLLAKRFERPFFYPVTPDSTRYRLRSPDAGLRAGMVRREPSPAEH